MYKFCSTVLLMCVAAQAGHNNIYTDFSSNQEGNYYYPAPPKSQQLEETPQHNFATSRQYQQLSSIPIPTIAPQQRLQSVQAYEYHNVAAQQQHQHQHQQQQQPSRYQNVQSKPQYQNYYDSSLPATHHSSVVANQFNSPTLDNAAFTMALTSQGYTVGHAPAARSLATQSQSSSSPQLSSSSSSSSSSTPSLNVKLPLPFGVAPLNIASLPLQGGAPYSTLQTSLNSYGTTYPQKRKR